MVVEDESGKSQRAIQSIEVGGRLLLALASSPVPMTLKDLAAKAALPPSRAHPYLVSYGRLGLVQQDASGGRYALGPAALRLGLTALQQCDPVRAAEPVAEALAARSGQAVAVSIWGNFGPTVIRMIDARQPLHVAMRAGTVMSLFGTATGRAFAAVLQPEAIAEASACIALGDGPGADAQAGSAVGSAAGVAVGSAAGIAVGSAAGIAVGSAAGIAAGIAAAREEFGRHGCTRAVGRPIPGVNAFSAPVHDHHGVPVLVLTLLGHQDHVPSHWASPMAAAVRHAAAEASARLGWNGSGAPRSAPR